MGGRSSARLSVSRLSAPESIATAMESCSSVARPLHQRSPLKARAAEQTLLFTPAGACKMAQQHATEFEQESSQNSRLQGSDCAQHC